MKFSDLKVGEEYAFAKGKQNNEHLFNPLRCILLSIEPYHNASWLYPYVHQNERGMNHALEDYAVIPGAQRRTYERGKGYVQPRQRVLVAVELPTFTETDIDPVTGEPWYDSRYSKTKWVETGTVWVPYAALPSELRVLWSSITDEIAAKKEAQRLWNKRDIERAAAHEVEMERKRAENAVRAAEFKKEREQRQEFFDQRVAPLLAEAGVDLDTDVQFNSAGTFTNIKTDALAKLLRVIEEERSKQ